MLFFPFLSLDEGLALGKGRGVRAEGKKRAWASMPRRRNERRTFFLVCLFNMISFATKSTLDRRSAVQFFVHIAYIITGIADQ